jgi:SAM-dependent methyltransferase
MDRARQLREGVWRAYSNVAEQPEAGHPFAVGRQFAEQLGYPQELLDALPTVAVEAFTGVSNVSLFADLPVGARVLDLGCGAGLDSLIAARRVGPMGSVVGVDFSESMLARARQAASQAQASNVEFRPGDAERLPLDEASIDIALVNGLFNLNPAREAIFRELARVVRPGGVAYSAEMILRGPLPPDEQASLTNWFA